MGRRMVFVLLCSAIIWARGYGQGQKPVEKTYVLKAAAMFDGQSDVLVTPGLVVVTGNRIIGVAAGATIPAGAEVIDLGDATLLPGFIDAHTHLTFPFSDDYNEEGWTAFERRWQSVRWMPVSTRASLSWRESQRFEMLAQPIISMSACAMPSRTATSPDPGCW